MEQDQNITCQHHRVAGDVVFGRGYSSLQGWVRSMADSHDRRFDELYAQHFREVLAYCLRRGQVDDAYDAANEVFAIAWRRIADVPRGDSARPWLFVVAKRVLYRRRRGSRRFHRLVERMGSLKQSGGLDPATVVVQRAEYDAVVEAASHLSTQDREVLNLAAWEGLPHREIAEVLGCSIDAVDQRLHRAKQRLAKQYAALGFDRDRPYAVGGEES